MQSHYDACFEREMGCTESEWLGWLPKAIGEHYHKLYAQSASVRIGEGALALKWHPGEPRLIGLVRIPRLLVSFCFEGVDVAQRHDFMKRFDLYMQRGGG